MTATTTTTATSTVTVSAGALARILGVVLPHVDMEGETTVDATDVALVRLEIDGGHLIIAATDHYSLGVARTPVDSPADLAVNLMVSGAVALLHACHADPAATVEFSVSTTPEGDPDLSAHVGPRHVAVELGHPQAVPSHWRTPIRHILEDPPADTAPSISTELLRRSLLHTPGVPWMDQPPARIDVRRRGVLVSHGDWYLAVFMKRLMYDLADDPQPRDLAEDLTGRTTP